MKKKNILGTIFNLAEANPIDVILGDKETWGICPFCKTNMNPERWTISDNGYMREMQTSTICDSMVGEIM